MPEHLRALVVILVLATAVFSFAKAPACVVTSTTGDFERRRNVWFAMTLAAFLAHNFWIYIVCAGAMLVFAASREQNKLAMFFFLLFALPRISSQIPALGIVNYLFEIDYVRLLAITILLPTFLILRSQPNSQPFGRSIPDKLIAGYLILNALIMLTYGPFTSALRHGVFYAFIDVFLPYYVASRSLRKLQEFRDALMAFVVGALVLSAIGVFEFVWRWLLYSSLDNALGGRWGAGIPLFRDANLRAAGTSGQPIPMGFVIAVAIGIMLYLKKLVPNSVVWGLGLALLIAGLIATISRGPWVGAVVILLIFIGTGAAASLRFAKLGVLVIIVLPLLLVSPVGDKFIDYLPFVGSIQAENVAYRQRLLEIGIQVMLQNPFFGSSDFIDANAMQELARSQGVDLVNTYLGVGLSRGLVGLSLFVGFFAAIAIRIYRSMRDLADRNDERHLLGQALLSTLLGILVIIMTVSSISVIPFVYWSVAGLGVAYACMLAHDKVPEAEGFIRSRPARATPPRHRSTFPR